MNILKVGSSGLDVSRIQNILLSQGYFTGRPGGNFGPKTEEAVIYFQQTHQGPDGRMLEDDGIVGAATLWALEHPSGSEQKSGIKVEGEVGVKRFGLTPLRNAVVQQALVEHRLKVREIPDGSNSGDGVDKYIEGFGPAFWCMLFVSYVFKQAGCPLLGQAQSAHCQTVWKRAVSRGAAKPKLGYTPIPGDVFIMLYSRDGVFTGSGHTGIVSAVSEDGRSFNAVEGNAGNRVKQTLRQMSQSTLVGFINDYPADEQPTGFPRGVVHGTAELATR